MYIYLAGDIGGYKSQEILERTLQWQKFEISPEDRLVLLGDNVYPKGVPPPEDEEYQEMAKRFTRLIQHALGFYSDPIYLLPGNHDYHQGKDDGDLYWQSQLALAKNEFGPRINPAKTLPSRICLDNISLILVDTQQYLQPQKRNAQAASLNTLIVQLEAALEASQGTYTVVCGHHPFYSRAMHGGKFSLKEHLFPLSLVRKRLMIPLPILGSAIALGRRALGLREDMRHPKYWRLRSAMIGVFSQYHNLIYASGHDHNLQHYPLYGNQFVISGASSKLAYVRPGGRADFVAKKLGFFRVGGGAGYMHLQALDFEGTLLAEWPWEVLIPSPKHPTPA